MASIDQVGVLGESAHDRQSRCPPRRMRIGGLFCPSERELDRDERALPGMEERYELREQPGLTLGLEPELSPYVEVLGEEL
jgi:hypothetical protein